MVVRIRFTADAAHRNALRVRSVLVLLPASSNCKQANSDQYTDYERTYFKEAKLFLQGVSIISKKDS